MMKRFICLILAVALVFTLNGCVTVDNPAGGVNEIVIPSGPITDVQEESSGEIGADGQGEAQEIDRVIVPSVNDTDSNETGEDQAGQGNSGEEQNPVTPDAPSNPAPIPDTYIPSEPNNEPITPDEVRRLVKEKMLSDGYIYGTEASVLSTDKVSMSNLYDNYIIPSYSELDSEVMAAVNSGSPQRVNIAEQDVQGYMQEFTYTRSYCPVVMVSQIGNGPKTYFVDITATRAAMQEHLSSQETVNAMNNIRSAIEECGIYEGMLQRDAIDRFNEYICNRVEYDSVNYSFSLEAFFVEGKAICNSYAQVFELLCRTVGINARFVGGTADGGSHAWNEVEFSDGTVLLFDICWNDSYVSVGNEKFQCRDSYMYATYFPNRTVAYAQPFGYYKFSKS